jgi:hypothetical protein
MIYVGAKCEQRFFFILFFIGMELYSSELIFTRGDYGLVWDEEEVFLRLGLPEIWYFSKRGWGSSLDLYSLDFLLEEESDCLQEVCDLTLFWTPNSLYETGLIVGPQFSSCVILDDGGARYSAKAGFLFQWLNTQSENRTSLPFASRIIQLEGGYDIIDRSFSASFSLDISLFFHTVIEVFKDTYS